MTLIRLLASLAFLTCVSGAAEAVEIRTATGLAAIAETPKRVAVFDVAAIDTLDALGVAPAGAPATIFVPQLETVAKKAEPVGTLFEPDLEALNALRPDLIIVGGRSSPRSASTSRVAPTIDMTMAGADLLAESRERLDAYGALFGRQAQARAIEEKLDAAVSAARAAVAGKGKALILMTNGPKITVYGAGSRFGWLHAGLGISPAVERIGAAVHGEAASFEFIAKADPDWLIVVDRAAALGAGEQNARATLDNELVAGTTAWRKHQVIFLPAADVYIAAGGVQATMRVLDTVTRAFSAAK
ncbi:siderophore ABC transporter substrate-binding protein [Chenggangzhangella methanolivorans]|uniref:siderophore ABC transporter substrate-binding protein n=1 Tax=Chenggangzhangella methanolivorans TaxID=1437009 RepID=UPI0036115C1A